MRIIVSVIFFVLIFNSCSTSYDVEVRSIDSLLVVLDTASMRLNMLDSGSIFRFKREGKELTEKLGQLTHNLSKEDAILLDQFLAIHRAFRKWSEKVPNYYHEIHIVPQQLNNLRRDLSRGLLEKEKAIVYFAKEEAAAVALAEAINNIKSGLESVTPIYVESREKILILIERLKAVKQTES